MLYHSALTAAQLDWVSGQAPALNQTLTAKIRYRQQEQTCWIRKIEADQIWVEFEKPQKAITPGQSIVFYQQQACLGGGVIQHRAHQWQTLNA
jgi:tRNA-specific 2-thiouridylase